MKKWRYCILILTVLVFLILPVAATIVIEQPLPNERFVSNEAPTFKAVSSDGMKTMVWSSDRDGYLGEGAEITPTTLSPGVHYITVSKGTDQTVITIRVFKDLLALYQAPLSEAEIARLQTEFQFIYKDGNSDPQALELWSAYDTYTFDQTSSDPSKIVALAQLDLLRHQRFAKPIPFANGLTLIDYVRLSTKTIELRLDCGLNQAGGGTISLSRGSSVWPPTLYDPNNPDACKLPPSSNADTLGPYIYPLSLIIHENRHNELGDPGHTTCPSWHNGQIGEGMDQSFEPGSGRARDAEYMMWVFKYGKTDPLEYKQLAEWAAQSILQVSFCEKPSSSSPTIQVLINELLDPPAITLSTGGSGSYFAGDTIILRGKNRLSTKTYLYLTGPNLNPNGILLGEANVVQDTSWLFIWNTVYNPGGPLDRGTYTIYASATPLNILNPDSFATASIVLKDKDTDLDGILNKEEQGPSGTDANYDGNGDGIPDWQQDNVASFYTATGVYITLTSSGGKTALSDVASVGNPSPSDTPAGVQWPLGFLDFKVTGIPPGGSTIVTIYLPIGTTVNSYWKYGKTPDSTIPHWYEFLFVGNSGPEFARNTGAKIFGNEITLNLVDGKRGDDDITVNAIITEPGGPGINPPVPVKVRIVPNTLNLASKGKFVAFITLPSNSKAADVDAQSVVCEGAPAIKIIRIKAFPNTFAAIFNREKLVNVKPGEKVKFSVTGTINKNGQKLGLSGSDGIKVINKKGNTKEENDNTKEAINDVEKMTDEKVFSQFNPR